jgi:hypothetical protein
MVSVTGSAAGGGGGCCRFLSAGAAAFAAAGAFTARFGAPSPALRGFLGAFFLCLPPMRPMPPLSRGMKEHLQPTCNTRVSRNLDRNNRTGLAADPAALAARAGHQQWARHVPLGGHEALKGACALLRFY